MLSSRRKKAEKTTETPETTENMTMPGRTNYDCIDSETRSNTYEVLEPYDYTSSGYTDVNPTDDVSTGYTGLKETTDNTTRPGSTNYYYINSGTRSNTYQSLEPYDYTSTGYTGLDEPTDGNPTDYVQPYGTNGVPPNDNEQPVWRTTRRGWEWSNPIFRLDIIAVNVWI